MMKGEMCRIFSVDQHYIQAFGYKTGIGETSWGIRS